VDNDSINTLDKFVLHGQDVVKYLDGGSALHLNLEEYPTKEGYKKLLILAARTGCNYFTTNVKITICNDCGNINKNTLKAFRMPTEELALYFLDKASNKAVHVKDIIKEMKF
jgi:ribonucleoside-triphosphate reductase